MSSAMIELVHRRLPRHAPFFAFNAAAMLFLALFIVMPLLGHFAARSEDIADTATQLSRLEKVMRSAKAMIKSAAQSGDPFLPGTDERLVSADLQSTLKAVATAAGVRVIGIRGLPAGRSQSLPLVAAGLDCEGSLTAIRDLMMAIENHAPLLFVTAATLRSINEGEDSLIRAELKVQGAMRDHAPPAVGVEAALP